MCTAVQQETLQSLCKCPVSDKKTCHSPMTVTDSFYLFCISSISSTGCRIMKLPGVRGGRMPEQLEVSRLEWAYPEWSDAFRRDLWSSDPASTWAARSSVEPSIQRDSGTLRCCQTELYPIAEWKYHKNNDNWKVKLNIVQWFNDIDSQLWLQAVVK